MQQVIEGISEIDAVKVYSINLEQTPTPNIEAAAQEELQVEFPTGEGSQLVKTTQFQQRSGDKYVRIETERLDKLINLVGELVISRTQVIEIMRDVVDTEQKSAADQLDRVTTELQHAAMSLRLVPIKQVFDRFPYGKGLGTGQPERD